MNQEKIGKFIAELRKEKKLTQEQLAEKLGITKNAVSKWERGLSLMDMSLLEPLSNILGVSVNEILAGEKIDNKNLEKVSNENILNLTKKEIENLKSIRMGTLGISLISLILIIYSLLNDLNINGYMVLLSVYNSIYKYCKYKYCKDKNDLILGSIWLVCSIIFFITHIISTIDISIFTEEYFGYIVMVIFGVFMIILGRINYKGNITTIHWYNRRKVTKENEKVYGKYMGLGTIIIGSSLVLTSILQMIYELELFYYILIGGVIVGMILMLYSQIKYNKGIF